MHRTRRPARRRPPLVSLLGVSGAGKTTLAAALVARWTRAGLRVGYLKHASHGFEMDHPGKDTDRIAGEGAAGVAVTGPDGFAYLERGEPRDPAEVVERFFADRDVVVLEGFRSHGFPAVVVIGESDPARSLAEARGPLLALLAPAHAVAAARAAAGTVPVFASGEVEALAAHLDHALGLRAAGTTGEAPSAPGEGSLTRGSLPSP